MTWTLPEIPEADDTPLVRQLLEIIRSQQERIQQLEDEIARLKGLKTRPVIAPSRLEKPPRKPPAPGRKRPGSDKRSKTAELTITDEEVVPLVDKPPGSTFKGYEEYVVQELVIEPRVILYRRERWQTPDGQTLIAPLPPEFIPGSHFGPNLICFIVHQYHHQHVTQPLLWEQLDQLGIDISVGQLSRILTEQKASSTRRKTSCCRLRWRSRPMSEWMTPGEASRRESDPPRGACRARGRAGANREHFVARAREAAAGLLRPTRYPD